MGSLSWMPPSPDPSTLQNPVPFRPHPLVHLRSGRIKKSVFGKQMESAIYKVPISGPTEITPLGIPSDEHAFEQHGGVDKALLHYSSRHYTSWKAELPGSAHLFNVGGFGENLNSDEIDEMTVCIGDVISIGEVVVEVSEPRAPCYKLNHRFEVKDMSKRAQTLFRVGWMYRIIKTGQVRPGDMISLIERPYPEWTVARIMYYLYHEKENVERMKEMVDLPPLGFAVKKLIGKRLAKGVTEDQDARMFGGDVEAFDAWSEYRIVEKRRETKQVTAFVLEALQEPNKNAPVEPGSHVRLKLGGKLVRAYSVVGGTLGRFELGIALDAQSRGASKFMHEEAKVADVLTVGKMTASFPLAPDADHHIIIAGGIGITSFLAALHYLQESHKSYELHFAVTEEVPFQKRIIALGAKAKVYNKSLGQRLNLNDVVSRAGPNTHIYCCGPQRLMDSVEAIGDALNIPDSSIHFEQFSITTSGDPFSRRCWMPSRLLEWRSTARARWATVGRAGSTSVVGESSTRGRG